MSQQTIELINLISSVSTIIFGPLGIFIGILACFQAGYYYLKSKDTEAELKKQLAIMACQNDMIKEVTGNLLSHTVKTISKIAQTPSRGPADQVDMKPVLQALSDIKVVQAEQKATAPSQNTALVVGQIANHQLPNLADPLTKEGLQSEAISAVGQVFIYAGLANIYAQYLLPPQSELETKLLTDPYLRSNIEVVNHSFATCNNAYAWLKQLKEQNEALLETHKLLPYVLQHEKMFNYQLRNAAQACEFWESLKKGQS